MCEPVSLAVASFAIGAVQSVASFQAQSAQAAQQNQLYEDNRKNALRAFEDKQVSMNNRISQEKEAAAAQQFDTALDARAAKATQITAAGESGVSGLSVEGLLRDMDTRSARYNDRVDENADWTVQQLAQEKKAQGYQTLDRINSVQKATPPSFLDAGLRIASSGVNAFSNYQRQTRGLSYGYGAAA